MRTTVKNSTAVDEISSQANFIKMKKKKTVRYFSILVAVLLCKSKNNFAVSEKKSFIQKIQCNLKQYKSQAFVLSL